jgi:hypothetical protein
MSKQAAEYYAQQFDVSAGQLDLVSLPVALMHKDDHGLWQGDEAGEPCRGTNHQRQ